MMAGKSVSYADAAAAGNPTVVYLTTADITQKPYEGERSLAAVLHMEEIVPKVLSFLTTVELLFVQSVNRAWKRHSDTARDSLIHRLHFGQFWSRVGILDSSHFTAIAASFHQITDLNLAYCNFMTGPVLTQIIHAIPNYSRITKLNLFYCYLLQDADIEQLVKDLPDLRDLNLGRVNKLTDRSIRVLAELPSLTSLNVIHNQNIGEDSIMLFDDLSKFPQLTFLNLVHCNKYRVEDIEELIKDCNQNGRNAQLQRNYGYSTIRIIGPNELFLVDKTGKRMRRDVDADT